MTPRSFSPSLALYTASEYVPLLFIQLCSFLSPGDPALQRVSSSEQSSNKSLFLPREWILLPRKITFSVCAHSMLVWFIPFLSGFLLPQALSTHLQPPIILCSVQVRKLCSVELRTQWYIIPVNSLSDKSTRTVHSYIRTMFIPQKSIIDHIKKKSNCMSESESQIAWTS